MSQLNDKPLALSLRQSIYVALTGLFLTSLIVANLMGSYLVRLPWPWGDPLLVSSGILAFPVTFLLTDLLNEFYGKAGARFVTLLGFAMAVVTYVFFTLGGWLSPAEQSPIAQTTYMQIAGAYSGMFVASLSAYLIGQFLDIWLFHWFRRITQSKLLWLRATGSTLVSQLVDSYLVVFIAFWGILDGPTMLHIATGNYWVKFAIAVLITPLLYAGHYVLNALFKKSA